MKIHIELKKKRYVLYAAIIALLGVVGANISILHTNADKITKQIEYKSMKRPIRWSVRDSQSIIGNMSIIC